jgi:hypothetical protein
MQNYTRNEWRRCKNTLDSCGVDVNLHYQCVSVWMKSLSAFIRRRIDHGTLQIGLLQGSSFHMFSTRFECSFTLVVPLSVSKSKYRPLLMGSYSGRPTLPTHLQPRPGLKLTVVLDYYEAKGTYSRIGLLRS